MSIREDGAAALEWVARYLERVGELPVLAQVEPGEIRSRLPAAPPEQGEPFAAVLRDLDEVLLPGVTHWQHPRYFAYFANTASDPGILAELLAAALNSVGFLWRTGPALTELELVVLDWLAQLLGLPSGLARSHRGHGLDLHLRRARRGARGGARPARRGVLRAGALLGREGLPHGGARAAQGPRGRGVPHARGRARPHGRVRGGGHGRHDLHDLGGPGARRSPTPASAPARGCTWTRPTRARPWSARSSAGPSPGWSAPTRWW